MPFRILQRHVARAALRAVRDAAASLPGDCRGVTAVEFGLICVPFFALLGAIVQTAFMIWAGQNLDYTLQKTVRTLFTGQFQTDNAGVTDSTTLLAALKTNMCGSGSALKSTVFNCSGVKLDVTLGTSFATSTPKNPIDPSTKDWSASFGTSYSCAKPGAIVIVTAAVKFPVFFRLLNPGIANFSDGSKLLQSTVVFRTEPYGTGGSSPC